MRDAAAERRDKESDGWGSARTQRLHWILNLNSQ